MENKIKKYAFDIQESINAIQKYTEGLSYDDFAAQRMLRKAIEREFEIIGEAMNRINKIDPDVAVSSKREIINMRNKVIHGYDMVEDIVIWQTIHNSLPQLKEEIQKILQKDCSQDIGL
jgi:uncharacterized protein with HEPN domain